MPNPKSVPADDVISEYQRWKQQGEDLRANARQAMEARFRDLLVEAVQIAQEYRADFGGPIKPPVQVTAFRYKTGGKPKAKKAAPAKPAAKTPPAPPAKPDRKTLGLQKRLETAKKKLEAAKAAGGPTKNFEDKVYEIEDELRLSQATA